jgi:NADH-quinone oxidoreductase subunit K
MLLVYINIKKTAYKQLDCLFNTLNTLLAPINWDIDTWVWDENSLDSLNTDLTFSLALNFASVLFLIGLLGVAWNRKNIIITFLCIELILFSAGLHFLFYYLFLGYALGQVFALLILTVATAETAVGLGIIILAYRLNRSVSFKSFTVLKG